VAISWRYKSTDKCEGALRSRRSVDADDDLAHAL
jgi:hypothetical protein